jgi:hypothetical protein
MDDALQSGIMRRHHARRFRSCPRHARTAEQRNEVMHFQPLVSECAGKSAIWPPGAFQSERSEHRCGDRGLPSVVSGASKMRGTVSGAEPSPAFQPHGARRVAGRTRPLRAFIVDFPASPAVCGALEYQRMSCNVTSALERQPRDIPFGQITDPATYQLKLNGDVVRSHPPFSYCLLPRCLTSTETGTSTSRRPRAG